MLVDPEKVMRSIKKTASYAKSLDRKECMLEAQDILMRKLAAEENRRALAERDPRAPEFDLKERIKDTEDAIHAMRCSG